MRAALYARVSTEEQTEGYSIDAQRRAFHALCEGRGWTPSHEYVEAGKSAHTDDIRKRPVFKQAIDDALGGKYDVFVVHRIDRFSRKLRITLEYFEKLGKAGVGFVSIENQIDYSTPTGKFMLVMQGGLAELYSDNLSQETKKGWAERKAQGLYCGLLPFGAMKGENGVPVPHPDTHSGLVMAFELASQGNSDREIAQALNGAGYRTVGNKGSRPFSGDTVRGMVTNKFYIGLLPDGNGGWIQAKHDPFISEDLWSQAQKARERNRKTPVTVRRGRSVSSLTGLAFCACCGGRINIADVVNGRRRMGCSSREKGWGCNQKSAYLAIYERQLHDYLGSFHIPDDYRERILEAHRKLQVAYDDLDGQRVRLETRLERLKDLYGWGDITKQQYLAERDTILRELAQLSPLEEQDKSLDKLAEFLANVADAWNEATQEQRNKIARCLFQQVWIEGKEIVAVRPQPEMKPFFELNFEAMKEKLSRNFGKKRPRWDSNPNVPENFWEGLYPVYVSSIIQWRGKIQPAQWPTLIEKSKTISLRKVAKEYGVSHEAVRRTLQRTGVFDLL
jgi:site-specific DNA recombinase